MSLHKLTVSQLRKGLLKKSFSPKEILDDCIQRIQKLDTILNAFPIKCFEKAYDQVKKLEQIKDIDFEKYPLFGIPVGVIDLNDIIGGRTTQ